MDTIINIEHGSEAYDVLTAALTSGYGYRVRLSPYGETAVKVAVGGGTWSLPLSTVEARENLPKP